ncbi:unnamed protein product [Absidia cylindrospora]
MNTNSTYSKDQERLNVSQQQHQRKFQTSNPTTPLVADTYHDSSTSLGANLVLPGGEPLPFETLLQEPENKDLTNNRKKWEMKLRDALRRNIQDRKEMTNEIDDLIKKAIDFQSAEVTQGTFDDQSDNELDDLPSLDPKLQEDLKKEFSDSLDILINIQKETPLRLEQYDKIDKILNSEKSTSSTPK